MCIRDRSGACRILSVMPEHLMLILPLCLQGCAVGSSTERTRTSITNSLKKKLADLMSDFTTLRNNIVNQYRDVVDRRCATVACSCSFPCSKLQYALSYYRWHGLGPMQHRVALFALPASTAATFCLIIMPWFHVGNSALASRSPLYSVTQFTTPVPTRRPLDDWASRSKCTIAMQVLHGHWREGLR